MGRKLQEAGDWAVFLIIGGLYFALVFALVGCLTLFPDWASHWVMNPVGKRLLWWASLGFSLVAGFVMLRAALIIWVLAKLFGQGGWRRERKVYADFTVIQPERRTKPDPQVDEE